MPVRGDEISRILKQAVIRARSEYERAHAEFKAVTGDIPSGLPPPDGMQRIRNAGNSYRATMDAYQAALHEFNTYITQGRIPVRLKDRGTNPAGGN